MPTVTICGLGPGGLGQTTDETRQAIADHAAEASFVRTRRHPTASLMAHARSFDDLYDQGGNLTDVYNQIAAAVRAATEENGAALYAVPGSPLILERAVRHLRTESELQVRLLPAVSFLDAAWAQLRIDPIEEAVRLVDGHTFQQDAAGQTGPLLVAHVHAKWVLSDVKLALDAGPEQRAVFLQRLGTPQQAITEVGWPDLDQAVEPDHLTSLYIPELAEPVAKELVGSVELMRRLRQDCPWDAEQTHASLGPYLLEETYEVLEAIGEVEAGDPDGYEHLEEELGDLWVQILFHSQLAGEAGQFTVADVARTSHSKLVGRHPHVFGTEKAADAAEVVSNWEARKLVEKSRASVMDGIPAALPALAYAEKVLKKADRTGAPIDTKSLMANLEAGIGPAATVLEVGELLISAVALARKCGVDAEAALRAAAAGAEKRFRAMEGSGRFDQWILG